jgi:hypothetical protein
MSVIEIFRQLTLWVMLSAMLRAIILLWCFAMAAISFGQSSQSTAPTEKAVKMVSPAEKNGTLVVLVTWGDIDNTPADDVYIEAYGFVREHHAKESFVLKMSQAGRYELSLPPGVYDVFVSEGTSIPRCRRLLITSGYTGYWTLKLEIDDVYNEKMAHPTK